MNKISISACEMSKTKIRGTLYDVQVASSQHKLIKDSLSKKISAPYVPQDQERFSSHRLGFEKICAHDLGAHTRV